MTDQSYDLDDVLDEIRERVHADPELSLDHIYRQYPNCEKELRRLLPDLLLIEKAKPKSTSEQVETVPEKLPERIGDYVVIREIGRGGMGVVYEARQQSLDRHVAVKVLPATLTSDEKSLQRFEREARAAARLHHTNIVPVFEIGNANGFHFYAMQLIDGSSLEVLIRTLAWNEGPLSRSELLRAPQNSAASSTANLRIVDAVMRGEFFLPDSHRTTPLQVSAEANSQTVKDKPVPSADNSVPSRLLPGLQQNYWRSVAGIGIQVADALSYSHNHGIVHRDIKPSNLVLDEDGVTWVTDFGLALVDDSTMTATGDVLGTLRYLAPERFEGACTSVSDVYSLGVTLYELATLRPAHVAPNRWALINQISNHTPEAPRKINPDIPRDLETIILKACERTPQQRYESAGALRDDLQRFMDGKPIHARKTSAIELLIRWSQRNARLAVSLTLTMVLLIAMTAGSMFAANYFRQQKEVQLTLTEKMEQEASRALAAEDAMELSLYQAHMRMAGDILRGPGGRQLAMDFTSRWMPNGDTKDLRGWEWYFLRSLCNREHASLDTGLYFPMSARWSPDSQSIAVGGRDKVVVYSWPGLQTRNTLDVPNFSVRSVTWSPDGSKLAISGATQILLWPQHGDERTIQIDDAHSGAIHNIVWSPNGEKLVSVSEDRTARIWDVKSRSKISEHKTGGPAFAAAWSPDSKFVAIGGAFQDIYVVEANTAKVRSIMIRHTSTVYSLSWSSDGNFIASASQDQSVKLWSGKSGQHLYSIELPSQVKSVSWSPDGSKIAAATRNGTLFLIDSTARRITNHLFGHDGRVWSVDWNSDGSQLASVDLLGMLKIWDVNVPSDSRALVYGKRGFQDVAWSHDGQLLLASNGTNLVMWNGIENPAQAIAAQPSDLSAICWSPDDKRIGACSRGGAAQVFEAEDGSEVATFDSKNGAADIQFSPDGRWIATCSNQEMTVRETQNYSVEETFQINQETELICLAWAPDSDRIAAGTAMGTIIVFQRSNKSKRRELIGHKSAVLDVAWNSVGSELASAGDNRLVHVWNRSSSTPTLTLRGHTRAVTCVTWAPGDDRLASAGDDNTARIWDTANGGETLTMRLHRANVKSIDWNPNLRQIATAAWDGTIRVWDATRGHE